jgi:hypothetical protein
MIWSARLRGPTGDRGPFCREGTGVRPDDRIGAVLAAVQRNGTCWAGGTTWRGRRFMCIADSNAATEPKIDCSWPCSEQSILSDVWVNIASRNGASRGYER